MVFIVSCECCPIHYYFNYEVVINRLLSLRLVIILIILSGMSIPNKIQNYQRCNHLNTILFIAICLIHFLKVSANTREVLTSDVKCDF